MKKPPTPQGTGGGGGDGKQADPNFNLIAFPSARNPTHEQATAFIREIAFHRHADYLHRLGPRAVAEFLTEIGERHLCRTWIETRLADYAMVDPDTLVDIEGWRR